MIYRDNLNLDELRRYAANLNARARHYQISGTLTPELLRSVILDSGGMCQWCGQSLANGEFEIEHILNLNRGGANATGNLAVSCPSCNRKKGEKHPAKFALELVAGMGIKTVLVQRILDTYKVQPLVQQSLFSDEATSHSHCPMIGDVDVPPVPPYQW